MTAEEAAEIERKIKDYKSILDAVGPELMGNDMFVEFLNLNSEIRVYRLQILMNAQASMVGWSFA